MMRIKKRYFKIDQHLARHFVNNGAGLSSPTPFLCSQKLPLSVIQYSPPIRKQCWNFSQFWNPYTLNLVLFYHFFWIKQVFIKRWGSYDGRGKEAYKRVGGYVKKGGEDIKIWSNNFGFSRT